MLRVLPAERGEELSALELQVPRQRCRLAKNFLELRRRLAVLVELEHDVRKTFEVRIDCAIQRDLGVAEREATLNRIVIPQLQFFVRLSRRGPAEVHECVETHVHVRSEE